MGEPVVVCVLISCNGLARTSAFVRGEVQSLLEPLQPLSRTWLHAHEATLSRCVVVHLPLSQCQSCITLHRVGTAPGTSTHMHASCFPPSAYLRSPPAILYNIDTSQG